MPAGADVAPDRAALVRAALRRLVARQGFHGTSMAAIAAEAGVATGTAYVHYESKDDLVVAAYVEAKRHLGEAGAARVDGGTPDEVFDAVWHGVLDHLRADPDRARFLLQVDASPYARTAHDAALAADGDPLLETLAGTGVLDRLVDLPDAVLYDLAVGPLLRAVAAERSLDATQVATMARACWRAVAADG